MHGHGTSCPQGVTGDVRTAVAYLRFIQSNAFGRFFHRGADVFCSDEAQFWVLFVTSGWSCCIVVYGRAGGRASAEQMVNSSGQRLHGAVVFAGALVVNGLVLLSILLVAYFEGGFVALEERLQCRSVVHDMSLMSERNVINPKWHGLFILGVGIGVLPDPEEIEESNVDEIGDCLLPRRSAPLLLLSCILEQAFGEADRDC